MCGRENLSADVKNRQPTAENKKALRLSRKAFCLVSKRAGLGFESRVFFFLRAFDAADLDEVFALDGVFL